MIFWINKQLFYIPIENIADIIIIIIQKMDPKIFIGNTISVNDCSGRDR